MKVIIVVLIMGMPICSPPLLQTSDRSRAQADVERILAKYVQATGGVAAHQKLTSRVEKGEWENTTRGVRCSIEIYSKAPNQRVELLDAPENRGPTGRGYDGTNGWSMNMTETGLRQLEGAELATMRRESDFYRTIKLGRLYARLSAIGLEQVNGREVHVLEAIPENGNPEKLYFDAQTGLLIRRDMVYGKTRVQHYFDDYREVDGVKLPFVIRSEGPVRLITRLNSIKHDVPIDDTKFKSPSN
jgi:outer membrane lipoprotein-sorting protein